MKSKYQATAAEVAVSTCLIWTQRFQEMHNAADAFRTAQQRARSTGKRHRLVDQSGALLDLIDP